MKTPILGARVRTSGYMVRHSTMRQWRERNPEALSDDTPTSGFKTFKRKREPFSGVFVGVRRLTIKHWWWKPGWYPDDPERVFASKLTAIRFWLVVYSPYAKPRYVLPSDVEVIDGG